METETSLINAYFVYNDTATTEIYTLSLHDALPIYTPTTANERRTLVPGHDMTAVSHLLAEYERAGATHCILAPNSPDLEATKRAVEDIGREVLPHFG